MIRFDGEHLFPLSHAPRKVPPKRHGRPIHLATVHRWATKGCKGIVLETLQIGGTKYTSSEALQRFFERLTHRDQQPEAAGDHPPEPSQGRSSRDHERTERLLDQLGL